MNPDSLGQFIIAVFLPFVPLLSGAIIALILVILFILFFTHLIPEESHAPAAAQHQEQSSE
jgi:hypothetical protein